jgi:NAD dependent epimerase/dehydratase family enzyme
LGTTLPLFKLGGGGRIGGGRQWWSWVALDDVVGAIVHALEDDSVEGPVNVGSPNPLTNAEYTRTLGKVLNRPTFFAAPAPAIRLALGGVADALLLASQRMEPAKLKGTGYRFRYPELEGALRHLLRR